MHLYFLKLTWNANRFYLGCDTLWDTFVDSRQLALRSDTEKQIHIKEKGLLTYEQRKPYIAKNKHYIEQSFEAEAIA